MILNPSEADIQISICDYLSLMAVCHSFTFFSIPNEGLMKAASIGKIPSKSIYILISIFKKMGLLPGAADLEIIHKGRAYFLEVKKPGGQLSDAQKLFRQRALDCGADYVMVKSVDDVISALMTWGIV